MINMNNVNWDDVGEHLYHENSYAGQEEYAEDESDDEGSYIDRLIDENLGK